MSAYTRPFHPLDFATHAAALFSLEDMIEQLRQEDVYQSGNRNALTLLHDESLTVVLTVARAGAECEEHFSQQPTMFIVLQGELEIDSASEGDRLHLHSASAAALAQNVLHRLTAITECAYLLVMGGTYKSDVLAEITNKGEMRAEGSQPTGRRGASSHRARDDFHALVRQLAETIDAAPPSRRVELLASVSDLVAVEMSSTSGPVDAALRDSRSPPPLTFISEAVLLGLAGLLLLFFLPPVAMVLILIATILASAGVVLQILGIRGAGRARRIRFSSIRESFASGVRRQARRV